MEYVKWLVRKSLSALSEKETEIGASSLVTISLIGGIRENQEMLDFCSMNNIACDIELIPFHRIFDSQNPKILLDSKETYLKVR
jgi:D-arabinose 1-dehydrogenase-like Zn-dependent alcohol dehydrogenase